MGGTYEGTKKGVRDMGLDMYLRESKYIGHYEYMLQSGETSVAEHETFEKVVEAAGFVNLPTDPDSSLTLQMSVGYWRKAHAIHGWFVKNVQDGKDECQESEVTVKDLANLLADCKRALRDHSKADRILPATDGFFFGMNRNDPYDDWYFKDLESTIEMLEPIVERVEEAREASGSDWDPCYFIYQASW